MVNWELDRINGREPASKNEFNAKAQRLKGAARLAPQRKRWG
jgi:hypothetical protein